jgi:hypothetical protein
MIMDRISDWIATAWELIGLVFLAMSADLFTPPRWEGDDNQPAPPVETSRGRTSRPAAPYGPLAYFS